MNKISPLKRKGGTGWASDWKNMRPDSGAQTESGSLPGSSSIGAIQERKGRFLANAVNKNGKGTHDHNWIFGHENAVCTKCGYTVPKTIELPKRGVVPGIYA
jgi:hypothetical protein